MAGYRWASGVLTVLVVGGVGATLAERASACSPPRCPSSVRVPPMPYLPGNLVYFQITGDDPPDIALRTPEGEPVAASIRTIGTDRVFAPEQPIAEGTQLVLEYSAQCSPEPLEYEFEFMASAPVAMEFNPGRLEIAEVGVRQPGRDGETSFVRVRHWPGASNGDTSFLMGHSSRVDGVPVWPLELNGENLTEVPVACRPRVSESMRDTCGMLNTLPPGVHTVEVFTHVVGATTQPDPVSLQVEVQCPDTDADSSGDDEPQPSTPDQETAGPSESTADGGLPAGSFYGDLEGAGDPQPEPVLAPGASGNGGGCALGSSGAHAGRGAFLALVAALVLGHARRRSLPSVR
jgi:hypothetical protein